MQTGLPHRSLDTQRLAASKPHGTRVRYIGGCRCDACRRANTSYESERQRARRRGDWNGLVDAAPVRRYLLKLRGQGVGRRAVQAATDVAMSVLCDVLNGSKKRVRARTARKIFAVTPAVASDRALVSAKRTHRLIGLLLEEGYTQKRLAKELGYASRALQFGAEKVTARNAYAVAQLYQRLTT